MKFTTNISLDTRQKLVANDLSDREQIILRAIVQSYVLSANPVGSHSLLKQLEADMKVSSATVRNVMADLEELGYVSHPHTSAGRIPTDKGYRYYVDSLMNVDVLTMEEEKALKQNLHPASGENILRDASKILGLISQLLGVVQLPSVIDLVVRKIELISLSSTRLLVVLAFDSDVVRTLTLEADSIINPAELDSVSRMVNERISGHPLRYVREHFPAMMSEQHRNPLVRLFTESIDRLFAIGGDRFHIAGTQNLVQQPEFDSPERMRGVIELIENEEVIVHVLERSQQERDAVNVMIGSEIQSDLLRDFSFVSAQYRIGDSTYSVGLIGPKRMNYAKLISLVGSVANMITTSASHE